MIRSASGPGSRLVLVHSSSGRVHVWDPDRGTGLAMLPLGDDDSAARFAGDDLLVTVRAADPSVFVIWDLSTRQRVGELDTPGAVMIWATAGSRLLAVTDDGIWSLELAPERWISQLCQVANRGYTPDERRLLPVGADDRPPCHLR